jgi:hypothetical protein
MTMGSLNYNARATVGGFFGNLYVGRVAARMWIGYDSDPPVKPRYSSLHERFESSILKANGKPYIIPAYRVRVDQPTVTRQRSEHDYSCQYYWTDDWPYFQNGFLVGFGGCNNPAPSATNNGVLYTAGVNDWSANDQLVLVNRLRAKMQGSNFDPSVFLAESGESLRMIAQAAQRIDSFYRYAKKGRFADASRAIFKGTRTRQGRAYKNVRSYDEVDVANFQLEVAYGWKPLLSDAFEGAQFLAHNLELPQKTSFRVTFKRRFELVTAAPDLWAFTGQDAFVFGQLIARVGEDFAFSTFQLSGLDDPASMAWERLPFSFVADWFIPIGNYLSARAFANRVSGTFITTTGFRYSVAGFRSLVKPIYSDPLAPSTARAIVLNRAVSSSLAVPLPTTRSLLSVPSYQRAANAVSLLVQRFGSSRG